MCRVLCFQSCMIAYFTKKEHKAKKGESRKQQKKGQGIGHR